VSDIVTATEQILDELQEAAKLEPNDVLVIGASSSEVIGKRIGTAGSAEAANGIVQAVFDAKRRHGFQLAFQCCEHLNRALVIEKAVAKERRLPIVTAVPVPGAGGAVASAAFRLLREPVLVEYIQAEAGIDIGDTFIGMHLRPVAVPVRPSIKLIGEAHVTMAITRPKLIGGARAVYALESVIHQI